MISAGATPVGPLTTLLERLDGDVTAIAVTAAVLFAAIAGVKFIASAGSPQRQAEARSSLVAAIVGLIITLSASVIVHLVLVAGP